MSDIKFNSNFFGVNNFIIYESQKQKIQPNDIKISDNNQNNIMDVDDEVIIAGKTLSKEDIAQEIKAYQSSITIELKSAIAKNTDALKNDPAASVRAEAARALGELGDKTAVPDLLNALKMDESGYVQYFAAEALGELGDKTASNGLIDALKNSKIDFTSLFRKPVIAVALKKLNDNSTVSSLLDILKNEPEDVTLRSLVIETLKDLGDKSAIPGLTKALENEQNSELQTKLTNALLYLEVAP